MYLGRVASWSRSAVHSLAPGRAFRVASWRAQVQNTCGFVSPQACWVHQGRNPSKGPKGPRQPRPHVLWRDGGWGGC